MFEPILANFAKHIALDETETEHVLSILKHRVIKKRDFLLRAGDVCRAVSFVAQGCLRVYHLDAQGDEHISHFAFEDWWAADTASFYSQTPAFYSIDALEDTEVFEIGYQDLESLYEKVPKFERFFRILTQNGYIIQQRRITSRLSQSAEERYEKFKQLHPKLSRRIAQKHIASFLGITPEFLSMLRKKK
jgi:CRP-like cAMP-binding protein